MITIHTRRSIASCLIVFTVVLSALPRPVSADWPAFRGTGGMGVSTEKAPLKWSAKDNIAWKVALPGAGGSSPAILGERIFLTCYSGFAVPGQDGAIDQLKRHMICLKRSDGSLLWNTTIPANLPEEARIRESHGYATSTPAADKDRVYAFFGKSGVYAFDHDGKQLWRADVGSKTNGWGSAASPVLYQDMVIINAGVESESLIALDAKTGQERWRARGIKESWNTPILVANPAGNQELVVAIMGKVLGFDPTTGQQLWSANTDIPWYMVPSMVAADGIVYCIGGRGTGGALAVRTGGKGDVTRTHRLWTAKIGSNVTSPIYHEGHLYWMHENNEIAFCAEAKTGQVVYQEKLPRAGQAYACPILADGKIYYLTRGGKMFVLSAKPVFEQLAANELGERGDYNASPATAGGKLYLRTDRNLYCIGE